MTGTSDRRAVPAPGRRDALCCTAFLGADRIRPHRSWNPANSRSASSVTVTVEESTDTDIESLAARLLLALAAGAVAEWAVRVPSGEWLLATRLDTVYGEGVPLDARAANADAGAHPGAVCPLAGAAFGERLDREGRERLGAAYREMIENGGEMSVETPIIRTDGQRRRIRIDGMLSGERDGARRASGFVRDVTEQRRLGEVNDFLSGLAAPLADIGDVGDTLQRIAGDIVPFLADRCLVEFVTPDGRLVRAADSHVAPDDAAPLPWSEPATRVPDAPLIERIVRECRTLVLTDLDEEEILGLSATEEKRRELADYRPCDYLGAPLVARGRCFGVLGILTRLDGDRRFLEHELGLVERVAERMAAALDNARLYSSLKESDRRKDLFLATLSHELRNPVGAISNGIEALRESIAGEEDRVTLAALDRQMQSLSRMLDDLLDIARINADKLELSVERVSLGALLGATLTTLAPGFRARGQHLESALPETDIVLEADPTRLEQILVNLLLNAGHYTPAGGTITLRARRDGEHARIDVVDSGIGLDSAQRAQVFDYFVQFRGAGGPREGGLGLGLGLVRRLVELHGGTIGVESEGEGCGCTFSVALPLGLTVGETVPDAREPLAREPFPPDDTGDARGTGDGESPAQEAAASEEGAVDILLVEDNADAANALVRVLTRLGHTVSVAYGGEEAVRRFDEQPFELVLLDIGLPDIDGYAVAARMRASHRGRGGRGCTLVALTGYGQARDRERALANGFDEHLVKPLRIGTLVETIARVAGRMGD